MEKIEKKFISYFKENDLSLNDKKYLLAVSGGVDSMVMLNLFLKFKLNFSVCTCNFNLRGIESEKDILHVEKFCKKRNVSFFSKKFNTSEYSKKNKISIQMSSRDLRYSWFRSLIEKKDYDYIVTAHHNDDNIETILFNFIKTTGYKGMVGIPKSSNNILRPLLDIKKKEILLYAKNNEIDWRDDISNNDNKYVRNKIRNKLIPIISEINPSYHNSINKSFKRLEKLENFINYHIKKFVSEFVYDNKKYVEVSKKFLNQNYDQSVIIYDFLESYGFNYDQVSQIILAIGKTNSKKFFSDEYTLINDRKSFYIFKKTSFQRESKEIKSLEKVFIGSKRISLTKYNIKNFILNKNKNNAQLDYDKVSFPLVIRNFKNGEKFSPLGMSNNKKISSYLSDNKISIIDKINQFVVEDSSKSIIWLVGQQINDKFKVDSKTKNVLEFEII